MARRWATFAVAALAVLTIACDGTERPRDTTPDRPVADGLPTSMAALGDSITAGYGACLVPAPCHRGSWSTGAGNQVNSHYRRILADQPKIKDRARNLAVPGARAADLDRQAAAVKSTVEYVTVLIGANDACRDRIDDMTPVETFRDQIDAGLAVLRDRAPEAEVFVASIPDIHRVWRVARGNQAAVRAWAHGVCPALLAAPNSDARADVARRNEFRDRIRDYNRQLSAACREYGDRCTYDRGAVFRTRFEVRHLAVLDFFHPNAAGHNALAEATFPVMFRG